MKQEYLITDEERYARKMKLVYSGIDNGNNDDYLRCYTKLI